MTNKTLHQVKILFTVLCLLQIIACSSKKEKQHDTTVLSFSMDDIEKPVLKDIFSSIEIDTLELSDNSLIGRPFGGKHFMVIPYKYYITIDNKFVISIFNIEGTFISNSINCLGNGPGEYLILQDVAYNPSENTIEVLDPFNNIYVYDINFKFLHKHKITLQPNDRFRRFYPLRKDFYALMDNTEFSTIHLYDTKTEKSSTIQYDGRISPMSANQAPFQQVDDILYFIPPEVNNNVFVCDPQTGLLSNAFEMEGNNCLIESDVEKYHDDPEELSKYIHSKSQKYAQLNRFLSKQYAITFLLKQGKLYNNIYNRETNKNRAFSKSPTYEENIPTIVHLEGDVIYAFIQPSEIYDFIDIDLVVNKEVLNTLDSEDNPCVVKYKLKIK